jgi:hypothetical protein
MKAESFDFDLKLSILERILLAIAVLRGKPFTLNFVKGCTVKLNGEEI